MGVIAPPRAGNVIGHVRGFPEFYGTTRRERIITGDIWAFLQYKNDELLGTAVAKRANSFLLQAFDFYESAATPRISSRPLLYYYAFLNLAKVLLEHRGINVPPRAMHGLRDPRENHRQRLHVRTQSVDIMNGHGFNILPQLVQNFPGRTIAAFPATNFQVLNLLGLVPAIHRTYRTETATAPAFCPIKNFELFEDGNHVWTRFRVSTNDPDVQITLPQVIADPAFAAIFQERHSAEADTRLFESAVEVVHAGALDQAIGNLATRIRSIGIWTIATAHSGYTHYLNMSNPARWLPQLCVAYTVMFYLGSITRYKPYDFDKIIAGHSWLISEFLDTQPAQLLHLLASYIAQTEVVRPFAIRVGPL